MTDECESTVLKTVGLLFKFLIAFEANQGVTLINAICGIFLREVRLFWSSDTYRDKIF